MLNNQGELYNWAKKFKQIFDMFSIFLLSRAHTMCEREVGIGIRVEKIALQNNFSITCFKPKEVQMNTFWGMSLWVCDTYSVNTKIKHTPLSQTIQQIFLYQT